MNDDLRRDLIECLGADVPDELLILALTHPSAAGEGTERTLKSNQRLEFLGDAVVGAVVAQHLYQTQPDLPEGELTQRKAALVQGTSLARAAKRLDLGRFLLLGKGEASSGGRERESILADVFEALAGALFLARGFEAAQQFVLRALSEELDANQTPINVKNRLQERTQAIGLGTPVYQTAPLKGGRSFSSEVLLLNEVRGRGQGKTKKEAECNAAQAALDAMATNVS